MFGKYFKTFCRVLNTPPVSLIWGLNEMYALLSKLSRAIEVLPPSELNVENASSSPLNS